MQHACSLTLSVEQKLYSKSKPACITTLFYFFPSDYRSMCMQLTCMQARAPRLNMMNMWLHDCHCIILFFIPILSPFAYNSHGGKHC